MKPYFVANGVFVPSGTKAVESNGKVFKVNSSGLLLALFVYHYKMTGWM